MHFASEASKHASIRPLDAGCPLSPWQGGAGGGSATSLTPICHCERSEAISSLSSGFYCQLPGFPRPGTADATQIKIVQNTIVY